MTEQLILFEKLISQTMLRTSVKTEKDALLYLTECLLVTVSDMAMKKSRKKHEYERHIEIAQTAINWINDFNCNIEIDSRIYEILSTESRSVKEWAKKYES